MPDTSLLRIEVTNARISQWQHAPRDATFPGHGFIVNFPEATLADAEDTPIVRGFVSLRARPEEITAPATAMLARLLDPFVGVFVLAFEGSFQTDANSGVTTVLLDRLVAADIQPD
jgi:hypothetical protein